MNSHAGKIIELYERHAYDYVADRCRVARSESAWLDRFIALLPQRATILDIGCGFGEPIARYFTLYHASLASTEYQSLLESNGFRVVAHAVEDPGCGGHTIWLAQAVFA